MDTYPHTWLTEADPDGSRAVIVEINSDLDTAISTPYWWVLCPASATLVLGNPVDTDSDCSIGGECNFDDLHHKAHQIIRDRLAAMEPARG